MDHRSRYTLVKVSTTARRNSVDNYRHPHARSMIEKAPDNAYTDFKAAMIETAHRPEWYHRYNPMAAVIRGSGRSDAGWRNRENQTAGETVSEMGWGAGESALGALSMLPVGIKAHAGRLGLRGAANLFNPTKNLGWRGFSGSIAAGTEASRISGENTHNREYFGDAYTPPSWWDNAKRVGTTSATSYMSPIFSNKGVWNIGANTFSDPLLWSNNNYDPENVGKVDTSRIPGVNRSRLNDAAGFGQDLTGSMSDSDLSSLEGMGGITSHLQHRGQNINVVSPHLTDEQKNAINVAGLNTRINNREASIPEVIMRNPGATYEDMLTNTRLGTSLVGGAGGLLLGLVARRPVLGTLLGTAAGAAIFPYVAKYIPELNEAFSRNFRG